MREKVILICQECLSRNYITKVKKSETRLEIRKYCPRCNKYTTHKQSK